jgi:hypothetical protein
MRRRRAQIHSQKSVAWSPNISNDPQVLWSDGLLQEGKQWKCFEAHANSLNLLYKCYPFECGRWWVGYCLGRAELWTSYSTREGTWALSWGGDSGSKQCHWSNVWIHRIVVAKKGIVGYLLNSVQISEYLPPSFLWWELWLVIRIDRHQTVRDSPVACGLSCTA